MNYYQNEVYRPPSRISDIKQEQDFNVSLDYLSENEFFDNENIMRNFGKPY